MMQVHKAGIEPRAYRRYKKLCHGFLASTIILSLILYKISHKDAPIVLFAAPPFIYLSVLLYSFLPVWNIHVRTGTDFANHPERASVLTGNFVWRYAFFYAVVGLVAAIPIYWLGVKNYLLPPHNLTYALLVASIGSLGAMHGRMTARRKMANKAL